MHLHNFIKPTKRLWNVNKRNSLWIPYLVLSLRVHGERCLLIHCYSLQSRPNSGDPCGRDETTEEGRTCNKLFNHVFSELIG